MAANDLKVDHYASQYQHWDLCLAVPLSYLEGCTTKYVARWRKKGQATQDLKKALHFLNKLEESEPTALLRRPFDAVVKEVIRFNDVNKLGDLERAYIAALCTWKTKEELANARELLFLMLDEADALERVGSPKPVPLTEENHYAERSKDGW